VRLGQAERVKAEADILRSINHPFIINLYATYQDDKCLYLMEEFAECGPLDALIVNNPNGRLHNEVARFLAAQIVMAVQSVHSADVVYRDLNPRNIMLDFRCYVKLVDFGFAKRFKPDDPTDKAWTVCGTAEYFAPEIIQSKGHGREVDWWALGVVLHEALAGYPPWFGNDNYEVYQKILKHTVKLDNQPAHFESFGKDIIKRLLTKDKTARLGSSKNGAEDIKKHKWYRGLNWAALYNKQMDAYIVPECRSADDTSQYDTYADSVEESGPLLNASKDMELFGQF